MSPDSSFKVLFFSQMTASPGSGGGHTLFNLLEPNQNATIVYYATPSEYPTHKAPFLEIEPRVFRYPVRGRLPLLRGSNRFKAIAGVNDVAERINRSQLPHQVFRVVARLIEKLEIDVVLASPQGQLDLRVAARLARQIPTVVWFMDDYYETPEAGEAIGRLWQAARARFVISDSMQAKFTQNYGGRSIVLNNSVDFPAYTPSPRRNPGDPVRIAYAGALNSYYEQVFRATVWEVEQLGGQVQLDVYSYENPLPARGGPWGYLEPIPGPELTERLHDYDLLLLLSSFEDDHRQLATTSLASKLANYMAAGRCILCYGPDYSENVRYVERHELGVTATSLDPGALGDAIRQICSDIDRRSALGENAYGFGATHRNRRTNREVLWTALRKAESVPLAD